MAEICSLESLEVRVVRSKCFVASSYLGSVKTSVSTRLSRLGKSAINLTDSAGCETLHSDLFLTIGRVSQSE